MGNKIISFIRKEQENPDVAEIAQVTHLLYYIYFEA